MSDLPPRLCPGCGGRDCVEPTRHGAVERFYCFECNLTFTGSDEEWKRLAPKRAVRLQELARRADPVVAEAAGAWQTTELDGSDAGGLTRADG